MRVALGMKARIGRAVVVAVSEAPAFVARAHLALLPPGRFAPYHAAEGLPLADAETQVARDVADAHALAEAGLRGLCEKLRADGHDVIAAGVLTGGVMPAWTTAEILAVHVRMHTAEGHLFREVLIAGARACGLAVTTRPEKTALQSVEPAVLAALGKQAGPPWDVFHKQAAAAALAALGQ